MADAYSNPLPRCSLASLPTPLQALPRLAGAAGLDVLWVKRDDLTGLAEGGNKTRKLEFLVADALRVGADTLITSGAGQSNHCRQTAAAAARVGLQCELVLAGEPTEPPQGNALLDMLCGATLHWTSREERETRVRLVADAVAARGGTPYVIPVGGSNGVGAVGYVEAVRELQEQLAAADTGIDTIVCASSSGGTQAGLVVGAALHGFHGRIIGVSIDHEPGYGRTLAAIANASAEQLAVATRFEEGDFQVAYDYLGDGYGVVGDLERNAIGKAARLEGLLVDPVYTGRALGGMLDLVRRGVITRGERVLFWHTGGAPALFAYAGELLGRRPGAV